MTSIRTHIKRRKQRWFIHTFHEEKGKFRYHKYVLSFIASSSARLANGGIAGNKSTQGIIILVVPFTDCLTDPRLQSNRSFATAQQDPPNAAAPKSNNQNLIIAAAIAACAGGYWYYSHPNEVANLEAKAKRDEEELKKKARELGHATTARTEDAKKQTQVSIIDRHLVSVLIGIPGVSRLDRPGGRS